MIYDISYSNSGESSMLAVPRREEHLWIAQYLQVLVIFFFARNICDRAMTLHTCFSMCAPPTCKYGLHGLAYASKSLDHY